MLRNGEPAPSFSLKDSSGKEISSESFAGKPLVMAFFRGSFCPTTGRYLTAYQDFYGRIKDMGMELVGVSFDSVENHAKLAESFKVAFPLLSDPSGETLRAYGLYMAKHKETEYGEPALCIVDKDGEVAYSVISSESKGLPDPGAIAPILIYMAFHGGKY